jgi:hypothetical protein
MGAAMQIGGGPRDLRPTTGFGSGEVRSNQRTTLLKVDAGGPARRERCLVQAVMRSLTKREVGPTS